MTSIYIPLSSHPSTNHTFPHYNFMHPLLVSLMSQPNTQSLHLQPSFHPFIHQSLIHSSDLHSSFDPLRISQLLIHSLHLQPSVYPSIHSSNCQSLTTHYISIHPFILSSFGCSLIHSLYLHPSFHGVIPQPTNIPLITYSPILSLSSITQFSFIYSFIHLIPSLYPPVDQPTIYQLTACSFTLLPIHPLAISHTLTIQYICIHLSSH